jgi:hypothetical protein
LVTSRNIEAIILNLEKLIKEEGILVPYATHSKTTIRDNLGSAITTRGKWILEDISLIILEIGRDMSHT